MAGIIGLSLTALLAYLYGKKRGKKYKKRRRRKKR